MQAPGASCKEGKSGLLEMYRKEQEAFREAVYRPGLCDLMWEEMDGLLKSCTTKSRP